MSKLYLAFLTFLTLPDHAARKSGNARRKPGTSFSDAIRGALGRYAAQSSGVKKNAIERFFHSLSVREKFIISSAPQATKGH